MHGRSRRAGAPGSRPGQRYFVAGNVIHKAGSPPVALCNFAARIVAEVTTDDGAGEPRSGFRVAGTLDTGQAPPERKASAYNASRLATPTDQA